MAWKDITSWTYTGTNYTNELYLVLQYDDAEATTTSVKARFSLRRYKSYLYYDGFGVILNPQESSRTYINIKNATYEWQGWPSDDYNSAAFTLTKKPLDTAFVLPTFWFVNTWATNSGVQGAALRGDVNALYNYHKDGGVAQSYKTKISASAWAGNQEDTVATNGTAPKIGLAYNEDNTVTIAGSQGENGRHNNISTTYIYYTLDGTDPSSSSSRKRIKLAAESGESYTEDIGITAKCTVVKAYIECTFKLGTTTSASGQVSVTYYAKPGNPGKPKIDNITTDFNNRLTVKKPWKISWGAAKAGNIKSPIRGYRFRVYKSAAGSSPFSTIKIYSNTKELLSSDSGAGIHRYYYDINKSTATSMTFYPEVNGIVPGDIIRFGLYAYTTDGNGTKIFSSEPQIFSDKDYPVQNAGIVRVKVSNTWKEGQVYVKVNGAWKEAETVSTKVNGTWKESE